MQQLVFVCMAIFMSLHAPAGTCIPCVSASPIHVLFPPASILQGAPPCWTAPLTPPTSHLPTRFVHIRPHLPTLFSCVSGGNNVCEHSLCNIII